MGRRSDGRGRSKIQVTYAGTTCGGVRQRPEKSLRLFYDALAGYGEISTTTWGFKHPNSYPGQEVTEKAAPKFAATRAADANTVGQTRLPKKTHNIRKHTS